MRSRRDDDDRVERGPLLAHEIQRMTEAKRQHEAAGSANPEKMMHAMSGVRG